MYTIYNKYGVTSQVSIIRPYEVIRVIGSDLVRFIHMRFIRICDLYICIVTEIQTNGADSTIIKKSCKAYTYTFFKYFHRRKNENHKIQRFLNSTRSEYTEKLLDRTNVEILRYKN